MVSAGGTVMVLPGTYAERIVIDKGVTLKGIGGESGPVIIETVLAEATPLGGLDAVVSVNTRDPVTISNITVHHVHLRGLNSFTAADLTLDAVHFQGEFPTPGATVFFNNGVSVVNNAGQSGGRAHLVVRNSAFEVFGIAITIGGDVDAVIEHNVVTHSASNSGCVFVSPTGQGVVVPAGAATNVDIVGNEFVDCGAGTAGKIAHGIQIQGVVGAATTGTVNIIGNTIQNTTRVAPSCNTAAILYEFYSGRIEHNTIRNATPACALQSARAFPAGVFVGSRVAGIRRADVAVHFNDIEGNAFAGVRFGANQTVALDASCNWWGSASGPSGVGPGTGDAIVVEAGAAIPTFLPFATGPVAAAGTGC
jgi:hypothetical protein